MKRRFLFVPLLCAAALAAACGASPKTKFYRLSPAATQAGEAGSSFSVALGRITVPELVDRPNMVLFLTDNTVDIRETERWAEPLKSNLARVVADNLSRQLGQKQVITYPASASLERPDYRVRIDVTRFESRRGESVTLDAVWSVQGPGSGQPVSGRTTAVEAAGEGFEGLVAAHSSAAGRLSDDIAAAIRSWPPAGR